METTTDYGQLNRMRLIIESTINQFGIIKALELYKGLNNGDFSLYVKYIELKIVNERERKLVSIFS